MKAIYLILTFLCSILIINSCKIADAFSSTGDKFKTEIDEIQQEIFPLDTASKRLIIGILEGATTDASKSNIDTLSKRISYGITNFLNDKLAELKTDSLGANLMKGITSEINKQEFKDSLNALVSSAFKGLREELKVSINDIFDNLSSDANKEKLESLLGSLFTQKNSQKFQDFLNQGLAGISFSPLADSLRMNLLNEKTRESINGIFPTKLDTILMKTEGILDKLNETGESFIEKNVWTIVASIASLMLLGTLLFLWRKKTQDTKMNDSIMAAIHTMDNQNAYDELTNKIKQNAIQRGVENSLRNRLKDLGLSSTQS